MFRSVSQNNGGKVPDVVTRLIQDGIDLGFVAKFHGNLDDARARWPGGVAAARVPDPAHSEPQARRAALPAPLRCARRHTRRAGALGRRPQGRALARAPGCATSSLLELNSALTICNPAP